MVWDPLATVMCARGVSLLTEILSLSFLQLTEVVSPVPTSTIQGQLSIMTIDGAQAVYTADLNIQGSAARAELINRILPLVGFQTMELMHG